MLVLLLPHAPLGLLLGAARPPSTQRTSPRMADLDPLQTLDLIITRGLDTVEDAW